MKYFKRLTALFLAIVLCLSFASAVEADEAADGSSGTIGNSAVCWEFDHATGRLVISGSGGCDVFQSAEDQPWAAHREEIREVWFSSMEALTIENLAYWFEGCTSLETAEVPYTTCVIGENAFADCPALNCLMLYYEDEPFEIVEGAFYTSKLTQLEIHYIISSETAANVLTSHNWSKENRAATFHDVYGINPTATGYCNNCQGTYSYTVAYEEVSSKEHAIRYWCSNCGLDQCSGFLFGDHTFNSSGVCTLCGYSSGSSSGGGTTTCTHSSTYTTWSGCYWYKYCNYCGALVSSGVSHGTYIYGSWTYYTSTQHRRTYTCSDCGEVSYQYASHATTAQYTQYSDTQHKVTQHCDTCNSDIGSASYESHTYTYGAWSSYTTTQHRRTKSCSLCGLSTYEYGSHVDSNQDGKCDTCGCSMSVTVTWDAGTNGGKVNGGNTVTTAVSLNTTAAVPSYTPTKTGHTFTNWYTSTTGGSLYSTVTITAARTFYAQFTANSYTITFDPGKGTTATVTKEVTYGDTYGELPLPVRGGYNFDGWFTAAEGGEQVTADTKVEITENQTLYAHWTRLVSFSVTVPAVLPLVMDEGGGIHTAAASIVNNSTGAVKVSSVSLTAQNGWTIAPYAMNAARQKVDSKQIGFRLQDVDTVSTGSSESLTIPSAWQAAEGGSLSLTYDAVVTALSQPVTELNVLSVIFVLEWA